MSPRLPRFFRILAFATVLQAVAAASAAEYRWRAPNGTGDFGLSTNWDGGVVPTATDDATFDSLSGGPFGDLVANVTLSTNASVGRFYVDGTSVEFAMSGADMTSTSLVLNQSASLGSLTLTSADGTPRTWTTETVGASNSILDIGPSVTLRTNGLNQQGGELHVRAGGALVFTAGTGPTLPASVNAAGDDFTATIEGTLQVAGLGLGTNDFGLGTKAVVNVVGAGAALIDDGTPDDGSGLWLPSKIGAAAYGELNVTDGASASFSGDLILGEATSGEGVLNVSGGSLTTKKDVYLGYRGGQGTLAGTDATLDLATLRLGDHQGSRSSLTLTRTTADVDFVFFGSVDPLNESPDAAHATLTDSTLNALNVSLKGHQNDDYRFDAKNSAITTVLFSVEGGRATLDGGSLTVVAQSPYLTGLRVETSEQGATASRFEMKNLSANVTNVLVGDDNPAANGGATLVATDSTIAAGSGLSVGNYGGGVGDARMELTRVVETGGENSALAIGRQGNGAAVVRDSNLTNAWLFVGDLEHGDGYLELRDSTVTASHEDLAGFSYDARIGGPAGKGDLNLYNSSLIAQDVVVNANGILRGDGWIGGDPLGSGLANVTNYGTISPGHSPGRLAIGGSLTNLGKLVMEIDLANPASYDTLAVSGLFTAGGTLELRALGAGTWDPTRTYNLITFGSFAGAFGNIVIDPKFTGLTAASFARNGNAFGINAQPVPEPATLAALGLGLLALRRRKGVRSLSR